MRCLVLQCPPSVPVLLLRGMRCSSLGDLDANEGDRVEVLGEEKEEVEGEGEEGNNGDGNDDRSCRVEGIDFWALFVGLKLQLLVLWPLLLRRRCILAWCGEWEADTAAWQGLPHPSPLLADEDETAGMEGRAAACFRVSSATMLRIKRCRGTSSRSSTRSNSRTQKMKCLKQELR